MTVSLLINDNLEKYENMDKKRQQLMYQFFDQINKKFGEGATYYPYSQNNICEGLLVFANKKLEPAEEQALQDFRGPKLVIFER